MKLKSFRFLIAPVLLALALICVSSTARAAEEGGKKGPSKADLKKYDANGDGQLDEAETAKQHADAEAKKAAEKQARLDKYDKNKDGKVSGEEKDAEEADKAAAKAEREAKKTAKDAEKK